MGATSGTGIGASYVPVRRWCRWDAGADPRPVASGLAPGGLFRCNREAVRCAETLVGKGVGDGRGDLSSAAGRHKCDGRAVKSASGHPGRRGSMRPRPRSQARRRRSRRRPRHTHGRGSPRPRCRRPSDRGALVCRGQERAILAVVGDGDPFAGQRVQAHRPGRWTNIQRALIDRFAASGVAEIGLGVVELDELAAVGQGLGGAPNPRGRFRAPGHEFWTICRRGVKTPFMLALLLGEHSPPLFTVAHGSDHCAQAVPPPLRLGTGGPGSVWSLCALHSCCQTVTLPPFP